MKRFEIGTICAALIISLVFLYGVEKSFCQGLTDIPKKKGIERLLKPESVRKCESIQRGSTNSMGLDRLMNIGKKFSFKGYERQNNISSFSSFPGKLMSISISNSLENMRDYKIRRMIVSNDIDYKILRMKVRKDIDFKIMNVWP